MLLFISLHSDIYQENCPSLYPRSAICRTPCANILMSTYELHTHVQCRSKSNYSSIAVNISYHLLCRASCWRLSPCNPL